MKYEKQTFVNGQVLTADCLNRMENGIKGACDAVPPACDSADCSKVLSYGANGCEWVDPPGNTLVVTITDGEVAQGTASHSAEEIFAHVQSGGYAVLNDGGTFKYLTSVDAWCAIFTYVSVEENLMQEIRVYDDNNTEMFEGRYVTPNQLDSTLVVPYFYSMNSGSEYRCETHTARELADLIRNGKVVIARLDDWENQRKGFAFMGVDESGFIKIWDSFTQDAGWSHAPDTAGFYADDDLDNKTAGNELWVEY